MFCFCFCFASDTLEDQFWCEQRDDNDSKKKVGVTGQMALCHLVRRKNNARSNDRDTATQLKGNRLWVKKLTSGHSVRQVQSHLA